MVLPFPLEKYVDYFTFFPTRPKDLPYNGRSLVCQAKTQMVSTITSSR